MPVKHSYFFPILLAVICHFFVAFIFVMNFQPKTTPAPLQPSQTLAIQLGASQLKTKVVNNSQSKAKALAKPNKPKITTKPVAVKKPKPKVVKTRKPAPKVRKKEVKKAAKKVQQNQKIQKVSINKAAKPTTTQQKKPPAATPKNSAITGGATSVVRSYSNDIQLWLEKHKTYPRLARWEKRQGTVLLYFVVDKQGNVLEYKLHQSSGHTVLDKAVEQLIKKAQPLPAIPDSLNKTRLALIVPIEYQLN